MSIERWGTLSVADHNDIRGLVANVMLYDRLVFPMFTEADDRDERMYWEERGWDPDGQWKRREQLGPLAIEMPWDQPRRNSYSEHYALAQQLNAEVSGKEITQWMLAAGQKPELPPGVNHADICMAYRSEASAKSAIPFETCEARRLKDDATVGLLIAHELGVPDLDDPEIALREAIGLSQDSDYRNKRADLYDFQMSCFGRGMQPQAIVAELKDRNRELIAYMEKQKVPIRKKAGFLLAQTLVSAIAGSFSAPLGALGGLIAIAQFKTMDAQPDLEAPHRLAPVAAFPDIERKTGLDF